MNKTPAPALPRRAPLDAEMKGVLEELFQNVGTCCQVAMLSEQEMRRRLAPAPEFEMIIKLLKLAGLALHVLLTETVSQSPLILP